MQLGGVPSAVASKNSPNNVQSYDCGRGPKSAAGATVEGGGMAVTRCRWSGRWRSDPRPALLRRGAGISPLNRAVSEREWRLERLFSASPGHRKRRGSTSPEHSRGGGRGTLVIQKTVRDVGSSAPYPVLTRTNYDNWVVMMKVMLEARRLWEAVEAGTTERQEDRWAMEAILRAVPPEMHRSTGAKKTSEGGLG
ncbi:hypothetical protein U9M48_026940 [Paspalum notatum var. saurae]|uniref:DUF4219 domain-containing protein n=1 Tax=Paspalum notatum var. saurae TaxID=547442 RepID=A0AAQ3TTF1_PASNO